jgi:ATP-dependent DNA ligase
MNAFPIDVVEWSEGRAHLQHACKLGLEGIVSERKDSGYQ